MKQMVRGLCLGVDADLEWEALPEHIRRDLVGRCTEVSQPLSDAHMSFWNSQDFGVDFETHVARCNYAVAAISLALKRVKSAAEQDYSGLSNVERSYKYSSPFDERRSVKSVRSIADLLKKATPPKYSVRDKTVDLFSSMYHFAGIACKFFSIAFVADPEYQRELNCTLSRLPTALRSIIRIIVLSIWIWAKAIQTLLLPAFLVSLDFTFGLFQPTLRRNKFMLNFLVLSSERRLYGLEEYSRSGDFNQVTEGSHQKSGWRFNWLHSTY
jgi:hypothetical protein